MTQDFLKGNEVHARVLQIAMLQKEVDDLTDVFEYIKGKKNVATQKMKQLEDELKQEMQKQYEVGGVVEIHPAVTMRKKTLRHFDEIPLPKADNKYIVINQSEMDSIIKILMDTDEPDKLLSVDYKTLDKLAKAKIPKWATYEEEETRIPSVKKKLGDYLINPLEVVEENNDE